jgi:hypothetical protein
MRLLVRLRYLPGNCSSGSPRFSGSLMTSLGADGVSLSLVLGHVSVNGLNNVRANRGSEYRGQLHLHYNNEK